MRVEELMGAEAEEFEVVVRADGGIVVRYYGWGIEEVAGLFCEVQRQNLPE